jgi:hypothetical protein
LIPRRSRSGLRGAGFASAVLLVGAVTLAPVWLSPVLATNDGPSHVYNAVLADGVRAGRAPFATYFQLEGGLKPDMVSHALLSTLGPPAGWDAAERIVVAIAMAATIAVLLALFSASGATVPALLAPLAGWLATNWFVWGGAYDFALSIPWYAGLLLVLRRPLTPWRHIGVQGLLGLLYLTHFFTFAAGIALVIAVVGWQALIGSAPWRRLVLVAPALVLLAIEMLSGGPGTGSVLPGDAWDALRGLVIGDFVVSVTPLDVLAGVLIMAGTWIVVARRWGEARRSGLRALAGEEVFGLALLVLSLVAPSGVGEGTYIPIRMRFLGVLALTPAIAQAAAALRPARLAVIGVALLAALGVHTTALVNDARAADRNLALIDELLTAAGASDGSWVVTRWTMYRRGLFHVAGYRHLMDRVAARRNMIVLDNYEALYGVFSTMWRRPPDWIQFRPSTSGLTVRLAPGSIRWPGGVFVLHESDRVLQIADPRLQLVRSAVGGPFAVTLVRRRE